jgi:hypothetical protein
MRSPLPRIAALVTLCILGACSSNNGAPPPLTLSGSVSGLTASGLVLTNGTTTLAVASGAKTFSFGAVLSSGMTYAVTVQTQPTAATCTVAKGSGTARSANIANVVVTCASQTFRVGGSVSNLTASGLVLANGSDTVAVAAGATSFVMPTLVATGGSYSVTVATQPVGEACAVTGGMGTMPAHAVTSIAVTCTDQPFTLGGRISGLSTSGLVIANGSDTVTVAANATAFTLPTAVSYGTSYTLTVATQPTGLTCSFSSGSNISPSSGTMPANDVTNTALVCSPQSYVLGGTVTGLTGGSLVLTDGTNMLTVSSSGSQSFSMPTEIAYGTQYALTVQTQPTGLTCTPGSNSTGTMPAGPVSVAVTCAAAGYTLGGSISGLTATGLVLANGSGNTISPAAGATMFSLPNPVTYGSTYDVIATTQPIGQTCAVTAASGTMPASNVNSVQVVCSNNTFTTAGAYTWTVPAGVTSIQVVAIGGGGAGGDGNSTGGNGAEVTSTLAVQPGDVLAIYVGGGGTVTGEGGGGGGLTYVGDGASNFVIAGGGGGGAGGPCCTGGNGGNGGAPGGNGDGGGGGGAGSNGNGGSLGSGDPSVGTAGNAFTDITAAGSGSGGTGSGDISDDPGGIGISSTIGNGGTGSSGFGAGGGGGGYGGGGGGGFGLPGGGGGHDGGGGGGGGNFGPSGTVFGVAPSGGPGAGGPPFMFVAGGGNGTDGSVVITIL